MRPIKCLVVLFLLASTTLQAQTVAIDTTLAGHYYNRGSALLYDDQYDSLKYYFNQAAEIFKTANYEKRHLECLNKLAETLTKTREYESSIILSRQILNNTTEKDSLQSIRASAFINIGSIKVDLGQFDSAEYYLNKSSEILLKNNRDLWNITKLYSLQGRSYYGKGIYDRAIAKYEAGLATLKKIAKPNDPKFAVFYSNMANVYSELRDFERSIEINKKAYELIKLNYGNQHPFVAYFLNNIGQNYIQTGLYNQALEYLESSISFASSTNHYFLGASYANISDCYRLLEQYDLALEYYEKAKSHFLEEFGSPHFFLTQLLSNKAEIFFDQKKYQKALVTQLEAKGLQEDQYTKDDIRIFLSQLTIAMIYSKMGEEDKAIKILVDKMDDLDRIYGKKSVLPVEYKFELGNFYRQKKDYTNARHHYQQCLISNVNAFNDQNEFINPSIEQSSLHPLFLLKTLTAKALCIIEDPEINSQLDKLKFADSTLVLCDQLVRQHRQSALNLDDKLALTETASTIYEAGIKNSMNLYQATNDQLYLDHLLKFMDNNKATVLSESINSKSTEGNGLIPNELFKLEKSNLRRQSYFQTKLNESNDSTAETQRLKRELFTLKQSHDSLINVFKNNYPFYYQLRYQTPTITLNRVQKGLPDKTAVIEYFEGDSTLYSVMVTKNEIYTSEIQNTSLLDEQIDQFREVVKLWETGKESEEAFNKYVSSSNSIFNLCLNELLSEGSAKEKIQNLIIIPDGKLFYVPFETLLVDSLTEKTWDYRSLNYLIRRYSISYSYSTSFALQNFNKKEINKGYESYIGFAPKYAEPNVAMTSIRGNGEEFLTNLRWNTKEVKSASSVLDGAFFINDQATESNFKSQMLNNKIVHLAMHAVIDDQNPMNSKLVFSQNEKDSIEDGFLYTHELLKMKINAELAVLSACNTGFGLLEKGEGIRSLAYGFSAAGCPSTLMSQWSVDDKSTSVISQFFYDNLSEGMSKNEALRNAKLDMIANTNRAYANPYYWGGMVLFGNYNPIFSNYNLIRNLLTLIAALLVIGYFIYRYSITRNTSNR